MTDEDLIARLRQRGGRIPAAAADRIEALVRSLANTQADFAEQLGKATAYELRMIDAEARAERLEEAASSVADDVCSYICPSVGRAGEPILHDPRCIALRAALKGEDHE